MTQFSQFLFCTSFIFDSTLCTRIWAPELNKRYWIRGQLSQLLVNKMKLWLVDLYLITVFADMVGFVASVHRDIFIDNFPQRIRVHQNLSHHLICKILSQSSYILEKKVCYHTKIGLSVFILRCKSTIISDLLCSSAFSNLQCNLGTQFVDYFVSNYMLIWLRFPLRGMMVVLNLIKSPTSWSCLQPTFQIHLNLVWNICISLRS